MNICSVKSGALKTNEARIYHTYGGLSVIEFKRNSVCGNITLKVIICCVKVLECGVNLCLRCFVFAYNGLTLFHLFTQSVKRFLGVLICILNIVNEFFVLFRFFREFAVIGCNCNLNRLCKSAVNGLYINIAGACVYYGNETFFVNGCNRLIA